MQIYIQRSSIFQNVEPATLSCFQSCKKALSELLKRIWSIGKGHLSPFAAAELGPLCLLKKPADIPKPPATLAYPMKPSAIDPLAVLLNEDEIKAPPKSEHPMGSHRSTFQNLSQHDAEGMLGTSGKGIGAWLIRVAPSGVLVSKYEKDNNGMPEFSHIPYDTIKWEQGLYPYRMKVNNSSPT